MAEQTYYTKEILFKKITEPTLIKIKIDNELYGQMVSNHMNIYDLNHTLQAHYIEPYRPTLLSLKSKDYDITTTPLLFKTTTKSITNYIFKPNGIPADRITPIISETNYERDAEILVSNNQEQWQKVIDTFLKDSNFSEMQKRAIELNTHSNFIKLAVNNKKETPLDIKELLIETLPNYLYFMAKPNKAYQIHFNKNHQEQNSTIVEVFVNEQAPFIKGKLGDLQENITVEPKKEKTPLTQEQQDKALAVVIIVAVIVLIYITLEFLKG